MVHDMSFIQEIEERYPKWELYDWTWDTLEEIVWFFAWASAAWGMRLHFLLLCHECHIPFEMIVYHDKVRKVLGIGGSV
jgi:polysaccharide pyruvyl transferase WcaK-like protein